jgi:hypothetical protein
MAHGSAPTLVVHGHFYQPAREDPFTGHVPHDPTAAPFHDWTARVAEESYLPNAALGNFGRIGWDLGPTLATWLRRERPALHEALVAADDGVRAVAQGYHHAILPLASARDRRTEIRWGLRDLELRTGRRSRGIWLPEAAVDLPTLRACAEEGVRWTILAPWQVSGPVATGGAGRADLGDGLSIVIGVYDAELSAAVSFDPGATSDADRFLDKLLAHGSHDGRAAVIATDGELYGHHQPFRELFLERLTDGGATARGIRVLSSGAWLESQDPASLPAITIRPRTSWSCHHGIARWSGECPCALDGRWKAPLRSGLDRLAGGVDALLARRVAALGLDMWAARDRYVAVASEFADPEAWARGELEGGGVAADADAARTLLACMAAARSRLAMFASDGWYWELPTRPETRQVLRSAAHAARLTDAACGSSLEAELVADLASVRALVDGPDGAALYDAALASVGQRRFERPFRVASVTRRGGRRSG